MAIIKCKMCGGDIVLAENKTYGTCEYCGSTMTFPKVSDEQKLNLFNRANHFRRQNEFDKAIAAYDKILDQDDTDAEAHWGAVLSRYGIEYVEDPVTHERIPTCHRVQLGSILTDADYLAALEHAPDTRSRDIYESEAKRIADIQKGILAISAQEKPYDVFICYKETDDSGSRTKDSTLAQDIYYQLTNEGYKVFFSRITLEDKLGQQYEPYIFAALNSAKVMLVIGTRAEYFNAVWVKNEWNRYLDLMKRDRNKLLIPCYRDMDPYDLPEELSALQSQDMSKIGFMQDIIRGVKKVLNAGKEEKPEVVTVPTAGPGVASLHKRAVLFLEDGDWDSASEYFDRILDIDPEYAPAYIGKVQVSNKVRKEDGLARCSQPLKDNSDYQKALRFASEQQKAIYEGYNRAIEDRLERERKEAIYREADALEKRAATETEFITAAKKYDDAGEIRDAKERAANCRAKAASAKQAAERQAEEYRKQLEREREERRRQEEEARKEAERKAEQERIEAEKRARQERFEAEKRRKRNRIVAAAVAAILVVTGGAFVINNKVIQPRNRYNAAQALLEEGKYDEAAEAFAAMEGYSNSTEKVQEAHYSKAVASFNAGRLDKALESFRAAGDYSDAAQQVKNIENYNVAEAHYTEGKYLAARPYYAELGDYLDSAEKLDTINQTLYAQAAQKMKSGDIAGAYEAYSAISDYSDSADIMAKVDGDYQSALDLWEQGDKTGAETALIALAGWSDADAKLEALREEIADDAAAAEDYDTALTYYAKLKDQTEAVTAKITDATKAKAYQEAEAALETSSLKTAYAKFVKAGDYSDATDRAAKLDKYIKANEAMTTGAYADARATYLELGDYLDSQKHLEKCNKALYDGATTQMENGDIAGAYETFSLIRGYKDSAEITAKVDSDYQAALDLWEKGDKTGAETALMALIGWNDVDAKLETLRKEIADDAAEAGEYNTALAYYAKLANRTEELEAKVTATTKAMAYEDASAALASGDLETAYAQFTAAGDHEDATEQATKLNQYMTANADMEAGQYMKARTAYKALGDYLESVKNLETCNTALYQEASALMQDGDIAGAYVAYSHISDYSDSSTIAEGIKADYDVAAKLLEEGKYDEANAAFLALKNFSDSEAQANESLYRKAAALAEDGQCAEAAALFDELGEYSDSNDKASEAHYNNANTLWQSGDLQGAVAEFEALDDYSDAPQLLTQVNTEIANKALEEKDYATALTAYQHLEQTEEIKAKEYELAQACYEEGHYEEATSAYETLGQYELSLSKLPIARYAWADQLFNEGSYAEAAEQFTILGEMTDSAIRANESIYQLAKSLFEAENYDTARATFMRVASYSDANTLIKECDYRKANAMLANGSYGDAQSIFESLGEYSDSMTKAEQCIYERAETMLRNKQYTDAQELYDTIDYKDSSEKAKLCAYNTASELFTAGDYSGAEAIYASIADYQDSGNREKDCRLQQGKRLMIGNDYASALTFFEDLDYGDSSTLAEQCHYALGNVAITSGNIDGAVWEYVQATSLPEARDALIATARDYAVINETEKAVQTLWVLREDESAQTLLEEIGNQKAKTGETDKALQAWCALGERELEKHHEMISEKGYDNLNTILNTCTLLPEQLHYCDVARYSFAAVALEYENFDLAINVFNTISDYLDAEIQVKESMYQKAVALKEKGEYKAAYDVLLQLSGFKDVDSIMTNDENISAIVEKDAWRKQFEVGNTVSFGEYKGAKIDWLVIATGESTAKLISKYNIATKPFNSEEAEFTEGEVLRINKITAQGSATWETCSLRRWLNGEFLSSAFSEQEQELIKTTTIKATAYSSDNSGKDTEDRVFLLSTDEAYSFISAYTEENWRGVWWWLRTKGAYYDSAAYVREDGSIASMGRSADDSGAVRPVIIIKLE